MSYEQAEEQPDTPLHCFLGHREHTMAGELPQQVVGSVAGDQRLVEAGVVKQRDDPGALCVIVGLAPDPLFLELEEDSSPRFAQRSAAQR